MFSTLRKERLNPYLLPYHDSVIDVEQRINRAVSNTSKKDDEVLQFDIERHKYLVNQYKNSRLHKIDKYPYYLLENCMENMTTEEIEYCNVVIQSYEAFLLQIRNQYPQIIDVIENTNYHMAEPDMNIGVLFKTEHIQALQIDDFTETIEPDMVHATNFNYLEKLIEYNLQ